MAPRVRLALMGALELRCEGTVVGLPMSAQRLLAFVALEHKRLARLYVAGRLWPDSTEERAGASLRSALWRLHRAAGHVVVVASGRWLALAPFVGVDFRRLIAVEHKVLDRSSPVSPRDVEELCRSGDLLPDWYEDWIDAERERFRQLRLHALEQLCERLTAEGRFSEALETGLAAVSAGPLRETAHRAMIGVHLAEGNLSEAVRQYDACVRLMSGSLAVAPSAQTARLIQSAWERNGIRPRQARRTYT
jgi:DNA-binding SARP family transcriptional activator